MCKKKPYKKQFKSNENLSKYLFMKQQRLAHMKMRLYYSGSICFGWLRPDEIEELSLFDIYIENSMWNQAMQDLSTGICTLRPIWWDRNISATWMNTDGIQEAGDIPREVLNYDDIKNWWHGFSTPGAHLWRYN